MSFDLSLFPALAPPPGVKSNFVDPPSQMPGMTAGAACIIALVTVFVALRIFTKVWIVKQVHIEDYTSILAWALLVIYIGMILHLGPLGLGREQWDVNFGMLSNLLYDIMFIFYGPTTAAAKLAVLFQIKRIFTTTQRNAFFYVVWVSIVLNVCFYFAISLVYIFQCWPREAIWNLTISGRCINRNTGVLVAGVGNMLSDIEALLLPAWAIWHLNVKGTAKLSIFAVFAVGTIALAVGSVGMWIRIVMLTNPNLTWWGSQLAMLGIAEIAVVIIVGCMPVYPRLFRWLKQKAGRVPIEPSRPTDDLYPRNPRLLAPRPSRRTGKSDPDTDILVTQMQEFGTSSMDNGIDQVEYKARVYNGSPMSHRIYKDVDFNPYCVPQISD